MGFILLAAACLCSEFDLLPPFDLTNTNYTEIGNWTLRRSALTMKSFLRLTSPIPFAAGGVCQRVPVYAKDWIFEFEVTAIGGDGGRGFVFHHTFELCVDDFLNFRGIGVWINTSNSTDAGQAVFVLNRTDVAPNASDLCPVCRVNIRNEPATIRIEKRGDYLTVDWRLPAGDYVSCTRRHIPNMVTVGYFSLFASTDHRTDDHDLYGINVTLLSPNTAPAGDNSAIANRKYLENAYFTRRHKKQRRRADMPKMVWYSRLAKGSNHRLNGSGPQWINDSYPLISEAVNRARSAVSINTIQQIVAPHLRIKLQSSIDLANSTGAAIPVMREKLSVLWAEVELSLTEIAVEIAAEMEAIQNESTIYARKLLAMERNAYGISLMMMYAIDHSEVPIVLGCLSFLEFCGFIAFFAYQKVKTKNFKKWN